MIPSLRGTLLSGYFAEHELANRFAGRLGETDRAAARERLRRWWRGQAARLGPASSVRAVFDLAASPLVQAFGFEVSDINWSPHGQTGVATLVAPERSPVGLVTTAWGERLDAAWLAAVRHGIDLDARWCLAINGLAVRLIDARRSYSRAFLEFEVGAALDDDRGFATLWGLLRAEAFRGVLDEVLASSAREASAVCRTLREGVVAALGFLAQGFADAHHRGARLASKPGLLDQALGESLTLVYRILFLLFAEARGLVPIWHPVYRDGYSLEALRDLVERPAPPAGAWEALLAISRLVHAGCHAGDLRVTPFNGRLFSPARTPLTESVAVDDRAAAGAIRSLSTRPVRGAGRARISYRDLGVEQLGGVYETVLDYRATVRTGEGRPRVNLEAGSGTRKATGTFYTPTPVTDYLVRRTLGALVAGAAADAILDLRVLDPAMGSGAFLVAACRFLASEYEAALVREGHCLASEVTDAERAGFRRTIAQRCLFGVDLNPMAVELARLSIWLATLAADRPLTFLDHHLVAGDSLVGASLADLTRPPPSPAHRAARGGPLPLFPESEIENELADVVPARLRLASEPADTLEEVRAKEQALATMAKPGGQLARWQTVADAWCASWFAPPSDRVPRQAFPEFVDAVVSGRSSVPPALVHGWLRAAREASRLHRFLHWPLAFPEVFFEPDGRASPKGGFDAVITNPPWDMLRDDGPRDAPRSRTLTAPKMLVSFARESGVYRCQSAGHQNRFQLFVERAARLCRPGGRIGLVVPWNLASDVGCGEIRRMLFDRSQIDSIVGMENRRAVFPIHRSVRFMLLTATIGGRTERVPCRLGERDPERLDGLPGTGADATSYPVLLGRALIDRLSGESLALPDLRSAADVDLFEKLTDRFPPLAGAEGWGVRFGRELNATGDRPHFVAGGPGLPVVEGKHVWPFVARVEDSRLAIPPAAAARLIDRAVSFGRARLAYRDVASATNRQTLIAAVLPAGCITTHTLFCSKTDLGQAALEYLCGILNSYVANYLVRPRVVTHVSVAIVGRLPVPKPSATDAEYLAVASLAEALARTPGEDALHARLQATVARLYRLTRAEFAHVAATFPLVPAARRTQALAAFDSLP